MTKELNLFLGETKDVPTSKTGNEPKSEKNQSSMFDDMLSNLKKQSSQTEQTTLTKEGSTTQTQNSTTEVKTVQNSPATLPSDKTEFKAQKSSQENKTLKNSDSTVPKEVKESTAVNEKSTMSLLDRMMLEANDKINVNTPSNTNTEVKQSADSSVNKVNNAGTNPDKTDAQNKLLENKETAPLKETISSEETTKPKNEKSLFDNIIKNIENVNGTEGMQDNSKNENKTSTANVSKEETVVNNNVLQNSDGLEKNSTDMNAKTEPKQNSVAKKDERKPESALKEEVNSSLLQKMDNNGDVTEEIKTTTINKNEMKSEIKPETKPEIKQDKNIKTESLAVHETKPEVKQDKNINNETAVEPKKSVVKNEFNQSNEDVKKQNISTEEVVVSKKEVETKTTANSEIKTTKVFENTVVKNENVAKELSKITSTEVDTKVNISKEEIDKLPTLEKTQTTVKADSKEPKEKSLMDKLVEESKQLAKSAKQGELKTEIPKTNESNTETVPQQNTNKGMDPLLTNMYLSSQKKSLSDASIVKVATGKKMASEAVNVKDVEKSAEFLNLGLEDSEVTVKMQELEKHTNLNILDKLAFAKTVVRDTVLSNNSEVQSNKTTATTAVNAVKATINENETTVQLNVSSANVMNIESRIIGARQQMGSMMSEVARNMYLNYKPPVTAFRMNLNPGTLGSIAIVMKNDRDNGLTISLNMSNNATLDSFVDNQASLRAALAKNFNNETNFTLDFNMQEQNSGNNDASNSGQNRQEGRSSKEETTVSQNLTNSENQESANSDYM